MDWKIAALLCAATYAIGTVCMAKATPIHGAKIAAFLQIVGYVVLLAVMRFGRHDLQRVTQESFTYGMIAAAMFVSGSYLLFMGVSTAPEKTALIEATATVGLIISGFVIHHLIGAMTLWQWIGLTLVTSGVVVIHLSSAS